MSMKRTVRSGRLTSEEAAKYRKVREGIAKELPELIAAPRSFGVARPVRNSASTTQAAREERGLSLADLTELTGMDRSALSKLETGQRPDPTLETLVRYAEAVDKRLVVSLSDVGA